MESEDSHQDILLPSHPLRQRSDWEGKTVGVVHANVGQNVTPITPP